MKTKILFFTVCLILLAVAGSARVKDAKALTGSSLSVFGKYSINVADSPMKINGEEIKTYELVYENAGRTVQIGVLPKENCTNFILKTDMFEIEYICNKGVFGVKKIDKNMASISKDINEAVLDRVGYFSQKVITQNQKTEGELLGLIACYFPSLIKEEYRQSF